MAAHFVKDSPMEENRKKALAAALSQIEKQFGKGSVMRLGDAGATYEVDSIPTGSLGLDIALGVGGIPRGRVIEIFGRNLQARLPSRWPSSHPRKRTAEPPHSWTRNMRLIR